MNSNTLISELTVGEFKSLMEECLKPRNDRRIRGVKGLAEYLGCSERTATRLKASGVIDKATMQSGRTVVFDETQVRKILQLK